MIISTTALAQKDSVDTLNEVVVTANKFPQKQNTTGKVVTVITSEMLSRSIGKSLTEVLNRQAGFTIIGAQNNLGSNQDVYLRGASLGKTLILIDGIPAYDVSSINNAFDLNHFAIENIERIEIVKGAQSTVHGSDAVAGVINIITKKGGDKPIGFRATAAAGSYDTYKGMVGVNGNLKNNLYSLQYSHLQSRGESSAFDSTGSNEFDRDAFDQNVISGSINSILAPGLKININGQWSKYKTDLDAGAFTDEKDYIVNTTNYLLSSGLQYRYKNNTFHFNYSFNNSQRNYLDDSVHINGFAKYTAQEYIGRSRFTELYSNFEIAKNIEALVGVDLRSQNSDQQFFSISSFGPFETKLDKDSTKSKQYSGYASLFLKDLNGFYLELGGRYNHHSRYGSNFTYTLNPSYLINNALRFFINQSSGYKVPSLYQLYDGGIGTRELKPESSTTFEAGGEWTKDNKLSFRTVYFTRKIKDGIDYDYGRNKYFNNSRQKDYGLEIESKVVLKKLSLFTNYTYVTGEVTAINFEFDPATFTYSAKGDTSYYNLFRRPKHTFNFTLNVHPSDKWELSAHTRFTGKRLEPVFLDSPIEMDGYHSIDLYAQYHFNPKFKAFADFKNITDQKFFDIRGYTSHRFNFMAGVHVDF